LDRAKILKIASVTAHHIRIPLRRAIRHASHVRSDSDNVVVCCALDDGTTGYGEGVPREYVTGETIESAIEILSRTDLGSQVEACPDFGHSVNLAERIQLAPVKNDERGCLGNAARCAVELAILDAYGRHFNQPLVSIIRLLTPSLYERQDRVRYSAAITSARGLKLRLAALAFRIYAFRQIKVKVGINGYDDPKRLRRLRRLLGRKIDLRVDANEAWKPEETSARIRELEPYRISAVEQPVPHESVHALADIRREIDVPIMLDESLCSSRDAEEAVSVGTCDLFNLRLSKCGGFIPSLRLAQFARQYGLGYQLGCQVGESAILSAAGRHFASGVAGIKYVEGSYDRHLVREALGMEDLTFGRGGWAPALIGPGLGVHVNTEALKQLTVREVSLFG
jgi:muconate cycloisomerase